MPDAVLAPEIVPVVLVADYSSDTSSGVERLCHGLLDQPGVAGEFSFVAIGQPTPRLGSVMILDRMLIEASAGQLIQLCFPLVALTGLSFQSTKVYADFNTEGQPGGAIGIDTDAALPSRTIFHAIRVPGGGPPIELITRIVLGPGQIPLLINATSVNTRLTINLDWRELPVLG